MKEGKTERLKDRLGARLSYKHARILIEREQIYTGKEGGASDVEDRLVWEGCEKNICPLKGILTSRYV